MKNFLKSLPFRLLMAIVIGILLGLVLPRGAMTVVVTAEYILSQLIAFCMPLIIIGCIAPSITKLGGSATRMLSVALILAYSSSVLAAVLSMVSGFALVPHLTFGPSAETLKAFPDIVPYINETHLLADGLEALPSSGGMLMGSANETARVLPEVAFQLDIPQIMPVMSALVLSVFLGLAAVWTKAKTIASVLQEFQEIVLKIVEKIVIPILPVFILVTFCSLSWEGNIIRQLPVFLAVILIVLAGHLIWLAVLYGSASLYSRRSGLEVIRNYGPAYLTAVGTMSSAATLSVALECAHKSRNLRSDMIDFGVPLFTNIHLCGSVLTEVFFVMTVSQILYGHLPSLGNMILFVILLGVFAIGAPGVPGGTVMASLGLITGILGFDAAGTALMLAVFALQDSFGTACNVVGDGALTLYLTGYAQKHGVVEEEQKAA